MERLTLFLVFAALFAQGSLANENECADLVPLVTKCARSDATFLQCVAADPSPQTQCMCLRMFQSMRDCTGKCFDAVELSLCGSNQAPVKKFEPASSGFLTYRGTTQPLLGIDGVIVLSLKRRSDRLDAFFKNNPFFAKTDVHVSDGFDCTALEWSDGLRNLFRDNTYGNRRSVIAHALSHFLIWRHVGTTQNQLFLIMEDDTVLEPDFVNLWNARYAYALPSDAGLVFLGGVRNSSDHAQQRVSLLTQVNRAFGQHKPTTAFASFVDMDIDNVQADNPVPFFPYGSNTYIISSNVGKILESSIARFGFRRPAGQMLSKLMNTQRTYVATPLLAHEADESGSDSDVQWDYTRLPEPGVPAEISMARAPGPRKPLPPLNTLSSGRLLPAFVVSLNVSASVTRLAAFAASATKALLRYKVFPGVDGKTLNVSHLVSSGVLASDYDTARVGTAGQALSHLSIIESLVGGSFDAALILEDDASLSSSLLQSIDKALAALPAGWHVLSLECPRSCKEAPGQPDELPFFVAEGPCPISLHAYVLSRAGFDVVLDAAVPLRGALTDQLLALPTLRVACARPTLAFENDLPSERAARDGSHDEL